MDAEPVGEEARRGLRGSGVLRFAAFAVGIAATFWLLGELRSVLQPLVLSILIWFLLGAVARLFARFADGPEAAPGRMAYAASALSFAALATGLVFMLSDSIADLRANLPTYRENVVAMLGPLAETAGVERLPRLTELTEDVDLGSVVLGVLGSLAGSVGNLVIIACFVFFLFAEAQCFGGKLDALVRDSERRARIATLLSEMSLKVETYLGVKCLLGAVQAVPTFVVLWAVGVQSPVVWAVLIFFLSFIPTLGSLIGIALPAILALIQFTSPVPFLLTLALLAPVQLLASNWMEPRLMGQSLNLSPLAIFIAIFLGGAVWGVVGALVSVPALTMAVIACAQAEATRPAAILLSRDGHVVA